MNTAESTTLRPPCYPRWVLLEELCEDLEEDQGEDLDAHTAAACLTSFGDPIRVCVQVAAPPAESRICLQAKDRDRSYAGVVASHGDSVLISVGFRKDYRVGSFSSQEDYFVYSAGAPPRPPSLLLLPSPCYADDEEPAGSLLSMNSRDTGLVPSRAGNKDDDLVVASLQLDTVVVSDGHGGVAAVSKLAKLHLLRHGKWSVQRPKFIDGEGKDRERELLSLWENHAVVSVGDGLMCWADYFFGRGLIFCNINDETPHLQYVQLPPEEDAIDPLSFSCRGPHRNVSVSTDGAVRFVSVHPRCCCGRSGATHCRHANNAYIVRSWTLKTDGMVWEMDGMVDATELWALDAYKSLPWVQLTYPIVSLEEPHVIFFILCENFYIKEGDKTKWLILVDIKRKTIRSAHRYDEGGGHYGGSKFCPSSVSEYFNSSICSSSYGTSSVGKSSMDFEPPLLLVIPNGEQFKENASNPKATSREETIFAALQEIPGLARDDMLKAYSILSHDSNGRRFRSLLELPVNLRKDWLLMEIKTSEACSVCSACTANSQHG